MVLGCVTSVRVVDVGLVTGSDMRFSRHGEGGICCSEVEGTSIDYCRGG